MVSELREILVTYPLEILLLHLSKGPDLDLEHLQQLGASRAEANLQFGPSKLERLKAGVAERRPKEPASERKFNEFASG